MGSEPAVTLVLLRMCRKQQELGRPRESMDPAPAAHILPGTQWRQVSDAGRKYGTGARGAGKASHQGLNDSTAPSQTLHTFLTLSKLWFPHL